MFTFIAQVLSVFDISKAKDSEGNFIEPVVEFTSGIIRCCVSTSLSSTGMCLIFALSHVVPFKCDIKPRSSKAAELIVNNARALETRFVPLPVI